MKIYMLRFEPLHGGDSYTWVAGGYWLNRDAAMAAADRENAGTSALWGTCVVIEVSPGYDFLS